MTARGTSGNLQYGPGKLYVGPIGTTVPTDLTTALDAAWILLGYTVQGSQLSYQISTATVAVEEELDVVKYVTTGRTASLTVNASEILAKNLKIAFNGGTITTGSGIVTFVPPALGSEVRVMLCWESESADERWIYPQALNSGSVNLDRRKGAANTTIPMTFNLEKPSSGNVFTAIMASARA